MHVIQKYIYIIEVQLYATQREIPILLPYPTLNIPTPPLNLKTVIFQWKVTTNYNSSHVVATNLKLSRFTFNVHVYPTKHIFTFCRHVQVVSPNGRSLFPVTTTCDKNNKVALYFYNNTDTTNH